MAKQAPVPPLAGTAEAAALLGVSKQRVTGLRNRRDDFPEPVLELACGPLWRVSDLEAFVARRRAEAEEAIERRRSRVEAERAALERAEAELAAQSG